jgi:hypothetical protein
VKLAIGPSRLTAGLVNSLSSFVFSPNGDGVGIIERDITRDNRHYRA